MTDTTFSDRDLIRLFERHLDPTERSRVLAYFQLAVSPDLESRRALQFITANGPRIATVALVLAATVETLLEKTNDSLAVFRDEGIQSTVRELNVTVDLMDAEIRKFTELQRDYPFLSPFLEPSRAVLVGVRRFIRSIRDIVDLPQSILRLEQQTEQARGEIASLLDAIERIKFSPQLELIENATTETN